MRIKRSARGIMKEEIVGDGARVPQWRVLHVIPNHEKKVAAQLVHRSVEHFLPLYTERSRWSDRSVTLERPLFPGYLFVRIGPESRRTVIASLGVLKILGSHQNEVVDSEEIERIRLAIATGCVLRPHPPISLGTRVRVRDGVFAGAEGLVIEVRSHCKAILTMSAVNQCYSLETDIRNLEIIGKKVIGTASETVHAYGYRLG
jgi:transcription antitermination factor NusG